jgi:putative mRNA 3-end processing factor
MAGELLKLTKQGLYCPAGDFYIDPWEPVNRAIITHAHSDHARSGSKNYLAAVAGRAILDARIVGGNVQLVEYGERVAMKDVTVSLHPAGHILGSAQVRMEHKGEVWVMSGDYKNEPDVTCAPIEPLKCHVFVTESTFGLPIYRWPPVHTVADELNEWWRANQEAGKASVLYGYPLGKAQRLLASVDRSIGPIFTHGAVEKINRAYRASGVDLPRTNVAVLAPRTTDWSKALIVAPPSAHGTPWLRKFGALSTAFASGWMRIRGTRRRKSVDRGFVLSDHADWPGLLSVIEATEASQIWVTHGYVAELVRWLKEHGLDARGVQTRFEGEQDVSAEDAES